MNPINRHQIVTDLLPLYADGACTEASRALVEEHLAECPDCAAALAAMRTPVVSPEPEKQEPVSVKKALKKLRRSVWKRVLCIVLVITVLAGAVGLAALDRHFSGGVTFSNLDELKRSKALLQTWQADGFEAMLDEMDVSLRYNEVIQTRCEFDREASSYTPMELDGETWYVDENFYRDQIVNEPNTTGGQMLQEALEAGDMDGFWYALIVWSGKDYLIPEELYLRLLEKYGDLDARVQRWSSSGVDENGQPIRKSGPEGLPMLSIETDFGTYYYRERSIGEQDYVISFPEDLPRVTGCPEQMGMLYRLIAETHVVPEELWKWYRDQQTQISGWFADYRSYYIEMGEAAYALQWQERVGKALSDIETELGLITDIRFDWGYYFRGFVYPLDNNLQNQTWVSWWDVTFESGDVLSLAIEMPSEGSGLLYSAVGYAAERRSAEELGKTLFNALWLEGYGQYNY